MTQQTRVAAYALVVKEQQILLCRLSKSVPTSPGRWTLPGGGLDFGESPEHGVVREVYEETGLQVEVAELLGINSFCTALNGRELHSLRILYRVNYLGGDLRYELNGTTDKCEWFSEVSARELPLVELAKLGMQYVF